jgi:hypothetical protein
MSDNQYFTGASIPKGDLQEALEAALKAAEEQLLPTKTGAPIISWRLTEIRGERGAFVGNSLTVTISAK